MTIADHRRWRQQPRAPSFADCWLVPVTPSSIRSRTMAASAQLRSSMATSVGAAGAPYRRALSALASLAPVSSQRGPRCAGKRKIGTSDLGHRLSPNVQIATLSGNIPLEGHFSAHGMPHRPCVIFVACGSTRQDIRPRPRSPSWCPLSGDGVFVAKVRSLPSARGPGTSVEVAAAPGAWRGVGKCAGGNAGAGSEDSAQLHASKATKPIRCLSASRRFRQECRRRVRGATPRHRHMLTQINWPIGLTSTAAFALQRCRDPSRGPDSCSSVPADRPDRRGSVSASLHPLPTPP
jgi:hypothetical protein